MELPIIEVKPKNDLEKLISTVALMFDFTATKSIDCDALGNVLRLLGCAATEKDIKDICKATQFEEKQLNGSIPIQPLSEYIVELLIKEKMKPATSIQLYEAFQVLDEENSGNLDVETFRNIMLTEGEALTENEVNKMLEVAIDPKTNLIPYEFFINHLQHKDFTAYDMAGVIRKERETIAAAEREKQEQRLRMFKM